MCFDLLRLAFSPLTPRIVVQSALLTTRLISNMRVQRHLHGNHDISRCALYFILASFSSPLSSQALKGARKESIPLLGTVILGKFSGEGSNPVLYRVVHASVDTCVLCTVAIIPHG